MKTNKDMALQSRDILQTFVFVPPTIQKSVKPRDFAELYLSLVSDISLSNSASLLNLRRSF